MKTHKYSSHSISRCHYLYPFLNINVETDYIKSDSGFSRLSLDLSRIPDSDRIEIPSDSKIEATSENLTGYFEFEFPLHSVWNILVVTDSNKTPMSIIYDTYSLNTNEVDKIHLKYTLHYKSGSITVNLNIGTEYMKHMQEYVGTNMQPIPKMLSRNSEDSILIWSDENNPMSYDNGILKDNKSAIDYSLNFNINPSLTYNPDSQYYLTGTLQNLYVFECNKSNSPNYLRLYPLNDSSGSYIDLNSIPLHYSDIFHINLVENGMGVVVTDYSNNIYYKELISRNPNPEYSSSWKYVGSTPGYKIIIPSFIDLCGCYVKVPNASNKTPLAYNVRKWTGLFNESATYGDRIYSGTYDYPSYIAPGNQNLKMGYWESLSLANTKTYMRSSGIEQDSPVSMHQFNSISPIESNCNILDLNLRLMTSLYVDLFNTGRLNRSFIAHDCGLEIVYPFSPAKENDFITYLGDHYKIPVGAKIMNMVYYQNTDSGSKITSLVTGETQELDSHILCAKYGIVITESMLTPQL